MQSQSEIFSVSLFRHGRRSNELLCRLKEAPPAWNSFPWRVCQAGRQAASLVRLPRLSALLQVLVCEHIEFAVQPTSFIPGEKTQKFFRKKGCCFKVQGMQLMLGEQTAGRPVKSFNAKSAARIEIHAQKDCK